MLRSNKSKQGLTVIEGIVAIAVLLIAVLSIINIFPWSLQISKAAELKTIATNLAQEKIEEIAALDYEEIGMGEFELRHRLDTTPDDPYYIFERKTEVVYADEDLQVTLTDQGIKLVTVTVHWSSKLGGENNLKIVSLISQF
ncbi:MAG: hypothetical protein ABIB97_01025 [Patescibacteria group bacterium]